jgi:hypothetical protein
VLSLLFLGHLTLATLILPPVDLCIIHAHHLVCISIVAMHVDRHFMHVEISIISWVPTSTKVTKCTTEEAHGVVGNS